METKSINNNYYLEMEVLTPLHIGAGSDKDWVKGLDYIYDNKKIIKLNSTKVFQYAANPDKLSGILIKKDSESLKTLLAGNFDNAIEKKFCCNINTDIDIKAHIKTGLNNNPFVPGSSLKGAIRSIFLNHFINNKNKKNIDEKEYFGSSTDGDEFMRFIKISDAHFNMTELVNTKIFNLYGNAPNFKGGWKHEMRGKDSTNNTFKNTGFNTIYEVIPEKEKSFFQIDISKIQFDNFNHFAFYQYQIDKSNKINNIKKREQNLNRYNSLKSLLDKKEIIISEGLKKIFEIINRYTKEYIKNEKDFFKKYENNETGTIIQSLENLLNSIPNDNSSCVLRMAAGSGFHSITGDWNLENHFIDNISVSKGQSRGKLGNNESAKSRKIAINDEKYLPMGFIKLRLVNEDEIKNRKEEQEKIKQIQIEKQKEEQRKRKEEKDKKERERLAKIEEEKKKEEEKIAKEKEIEEKHKAILLEKEKQIKKAQEENKKNKEIEIQNIINNGLVEIKNMIDFETGKKIIEEYYKAINMQKITGENKALLSDFVINCIKTNNKRWKKYGKQDWKLVIKWIGNTEAYSLYNLVSKK
jgi:CRISPR/Cas system CSM-associated protein Csm5 (group 7 of RAMP superfamily)